jgi:6-phosphogluconolactonase/glucosamine-6-phosphate isomerase/deaminase
MAEYDLTQFEDAEELARAVASAWLGEVERAYQAGRHFHVALSGGRITGVLFSEVTRQASHRDRRPTRPLGRQRRPQQSRSA